MWICKFFFLKKRGFYKININLLRGEYLDICSQIGFLIKNEGEITL